jgi:hypothetical protein
LHVLSAPPAFVLSQDQTLREVGCHAAPTASLVMPPKRLTGFARQPLIEAG